VTSDLKNVADHIADRVDYVLARKGSALGTLSWFTGLEESRGLACTSVPGTLATGTIPLPNPVGKPITAPTDLVTLTAGEHTGSLSDAIKEVRRMVSGIEESVGLWLREKGLDGQHAGADVLVAATIEFVE
jgi:hypothetical protein